MKLSLCIPMYNESPIIRDTARTLSEYMSRTFEDYEIIFANDGSSDGCDRAVEELGLPCVRVVGYEQNMGKGYAVRTASVTKLGGVISFVNGNDGTCEGIDYPEKKAFSVQFDPNACAGPENSDVFLYGRFINMMGGND